MRFLDAIQSLSARLDAAALLSTSTKEQSHRRRRRSSTRQHSPEVVKTMSTALGDGQEDVYQDGEYSMSKATVEIVRQLSNGTASTVPTPGEEGDRVKALYTEGKSGLSARRGHVEGVGRHIEPQGGEQARNMHAHRAFDYVGTLKKLLLTITGTYLVEVQLILGGTTEV